MSNLDRVLEQKKKDKERRKRETEKLREEKRLIKERRNKLREKFYKKPRVYFHFERLADGVKLRDPRDVKSKLGSLMKKKYDGKPLSEIPLSTELFIKMFGGKRILKYKIINTDWDEDSIETRKMKKDIFTTNMFVWVRAEENEYGMVEESYTD